MDGLRSVLYTPRHAFPEHDESIHCTLPSNWAAGRIDWMADLFLSKRRYWWFELSHLGSCWRVICCIESCPTILKSTLTPVSRAHLTLTHHNHQQRKLQPFRWNACICLSILWTNAATVATCTWTWAGCLDSRISSSLILLALKSALLLISSSVTKVRRQGGTRIKWTPYLFLNKEEIYRTYRWCWSVVFESITLSIILLIEDNTNPCLTYAHYTHTHTPQYWTNFIHTPRSSAWLTETPPSWQRIRRPLSLNLGMRRLHL